MRSLLVIICLMLPSLSPGLAFAQQASALPAPPTPRLDGQPDLRFDKTKTPTENELTRARIEGKLQDLQRQLTEVDQKRTSALSAPSKEESAAPPVSGDRAKIIKQISDWKGALTRFNIETQCNPVDLTQEVELYNGKLGPTVDFVAAHQASTGQIQWNATFPSLGAGSDDGNVANARWCTGTLISDRYFLTAGHCFEEQTDGWLTPSRMKDGQQAWLTPQELAPLMHVNFNYQLDVQTHQLRAPVVYPIVRLVEYGPKLPGALDYAIAELGNGADGKLPGSAFAIEHVDPSSAGLASAKVLTLIQHPDGRPKVIGAGAQLAVNGRVISYSDIDTQGGSSGSGIISQSGTLIGVHTRGGCTIGGGSNSGVTANAISTASKVIH